MFGSQNSGPEHLRGLPRSFSFGFPVRAWAALPLCFVPLLAPWQAPAAPGGAEPRTFFSQSGQFIVRGFPVGAPLSSGVSTAAVTYARLDPALLAVSCERIKQALLGTMGMVDEWRGTISILSHPVREDNEPIVVRAVRYADGWTYHLELPEQVDKGRLIEALTQVLLQEIANRRAGPQAAELPPWLVVGLAAHLQALGNLTLEPATRIVRRERHTDPLGAVRELLRSHPAFSFDELNFPTQAQLSEANVGVYEGSAQLFVHELLRLKDGRGCLREMLTRLPENLNWQTAFLSAFNAHFPRLIDVDKWWALNVVHFTGLEWMTGWPPQEVLRQLDQSLASPVQVRRSPDQLPAHSELKLQQVVAEWEFAAQTPLLLEKINHLQALRLRAEAAAELAALVDDYRLALESYLQERRRTGTGSAKHLEKPSLRLIVNETLHRLDELDARRESLRPDGHAAPTPELTTGPASGSGR